MKHVIKLTVIAATLMTLAGCSSVRGLAGPRGFEYEGTYFKGRIARDKEARENFSVSVRGADRGLPGALEAGRIAANRYCIEQFGNTDIAWSGVSPDDEPGSVVLADNGELVMNGTCSAW